MPLYEYYCEKCLQKFEEMSSTNVAENGICPKCQTKAKKKLISCFSVGGQGDLRESTQHGCHGCPNSGHSHS